MLPFNLPVVSTTGCIHNCSPSSSLSAYKLFPAFTTMIPADVRAYQFTGFTNTLLHFVFMVWQAAYAETERQQHATKAETLKVRRTDLILIRAVNKNFRLLSPAVLIPASLLSKPKQPLAGKIPSPITHPK